MGPMVLTMDRWKVLYPMPSYYYGHVGHFAGRRTLYDSDIFGYLQCFTWQVWVGVVVSILLISAVFTTISRKRNGAVVKSYVDHLFYLSAMFFWEANTVPSARRGSNRLLLGTWWIAVILLGLAFTSFMKASMTVKKEIPKMESVEDLARNPNVLPVITKGVAYDVFLKDNKNPAYQAVWNRIVKYRSIIPQKEVFVRKVMEEVLDGRKAIFASVGILIYWTRELYKDKPPQGEFYFGKVRLVLASGSIHISRELPEYIKKSIHIRQRWILEGGFAHLYTKNVLLKGLDDHGASHERVRALAIEDVSGVFAVLAIGAVVASLAAVVECLYTRHTTTRFRRLERRWMHGGTVRPGHTSHGTVSAHLLIAPHWHVDRMAMTHDQPTNNGRTDSTIR
ncbi:glutamate receptor 2-like [Ornithodoros turicata]|uniref:glutamate receptor 2-like n=1 Tax=Ornithodoros turicata TaxID=34597 RepID=UPI0031392661